MTVGQKICMNVRTADDAGVTAPPRYGTNWASTNYSKVSVTESDDGRYAIVKAIAKTNKNSPVYAGYQLFNDPQQNDFEYYALEITVKNN
jgi:hypothetical protein